MHSKCVSRVVNAEQIQRLTHGLHMSDRVKASVKEKSVDELLEHYMLVRGDCLTNMGVYASALKPIARSSRRHRSFRSSSTTTAARRSINGCRTTSF
jgi:hypothetical protein